MTKIQSNIEMRSPYIDSINIKADSEKSETDNLSISEKDRALYYGPNWMSYFKHDVNIVNKLIINPITHTI